MQSLDGAIRDALADRTNDPGMCLQQTRIWYEIAAKHPDASTGWRNAKYRRTDRKPPRGAPVWWTGGSSGHGHIGLALGDGTFRSTDAAGRGKVGTVSLDYPEKQWGLKWGGWSADLNGVTIREIKAIYDGGTSVRPKVYLSRLKFGVKNSDSVKLLQERLNGIPLKGGSKLPVTGNYATRTDHEVRLWQAQICHDQPDPAGKSFLGPRQARKMFPADEYDLIDDQDDDEDPVQDGEPAVSSAPGIWQWYSDKPGGVVTIHPDEKWHDLKGLVEPPSKIKGGSEKRMLYLRIHLPKGRTADRAVQTRFVRGNGDETAYDSEEYGLTLDSVPYSNIHFEKSDGLGGKWQIWVTGGKDPLTLHTRYAKCHCTYTP